MRRLPLLLVVGAGVLLAADMLYRQNLDTHVVPLTTVPSTPTDLYTQSVWLKSIELIPQSTTSPSCTIQDKSTPTPNIAYNSVALSPNHTYRDERSDTGTLYMAGGVTWSCTDATVKAQMVVKY